MIDHVEDAKRLEDIFRLNIMTFMGCAGGVAFNPIQASEIESKCILGSYSRAWALGHAVLQARIAKSNVTDAILAQEELGRLIVHGKVCQH